jgi:hypothetical protein
VRRLADCALALYPLAHRRRYGEEMRALLDDTGVDGRAVLDLVRGALTAHLRREMREIDAQDRLRLSATGILACWALFAMAGLAFYKTVEGAAFTAAGNAHPALSGLYLAIQVVAFLASAAVLAGAIPLIHAGLRQRGPGRRVVRRSLGWTLFAIASTVGVTGAVALLAHRVVAWSSGASAAVLALAALGCLACGAICVAAARRSLFATVVSRGALRFAVVLGLLVTVSMWVIVAAVGAEAVVLSGLPLSAVGNGPGGLLSVELSIVLQLAVMSGAAVCASVSSVRGWAGLGLAGGRVKPGSHLH